MIPKNLTTTIKNFFQGYSMYKSTWDEQLQIIHKAALNNLPYEEYTKSLEPIDQMNLKIFKAEKQILREHGFRQRMIYELGADIGVLVSQTMFCIKTKKRVHAFARGYLPTLVPSLKDNLESIACTLENLLHNK